MHLTLRLATPPAFEPLTPETVKLHLRINIEDTDQDERINALIEVAREQVEALTGRSLITQTWQRLARAFPMSRGAIELGRPPVERIEFIKYIDASGVLRTLDSALYELDSQSQTAYVVPAYNATWPVARNKINAVQIQFIAGYGDAAAVPARAVQAMLLLVAHYFENREGVIVDSRLAADVLPMGVDALLSSLNVSRFA